MVQWRARFVKIAPIGATNNVLWILIECIENLWNDRKWYQGLDALKMRIARRVNTIVLYDHQL